MLRFPVLPLVFLGLFSCERAVTAGTASLLPLLQRGEYLRVVSIAEDGLHASSREDETYREFWLARTEACIRIDPSKAMDAIRDELYGNECILQQEDVRYIDAKWRQAGHLDFRDLTLGLAAAAWPADPDFKSLIDDLRTQELERYRRIDPDYLSGFIYCY